MGAAPGLGGKAQSGRAGDGEGQDRGTCGVFRKYCYKTKLHFCRGSQTGMRKETLNAILSGYNSGRDDAENEHLLCSCSNVKVGLGWSTVRTVAGRGDEGIRKADVRQQKPSRLPNYRQLYSGVDLAPINTVSVTLQRRIICIRTRFPGARTK